MRSATALRTVALLWLTWTQRHTKNTTHCFSHSPAVGDSLKHCTTTHYPTIISLTSVFVQESQINRVRYTVPQGVIGTVTSLHTKTETAQINRFFTRPSSGAAAAADGGQWQQLVPRTHVLPVSETHLLTELWPIGLERRITEDVRHSTNANIFIGSKSLWGRDVFGIGRNHQGSHTFFKVKLKHF